MSQFITFDADKSRHQTLTCGHCVMTCTGAELEIFGSNANSLRVLSSKHEKEHLK